MVRGFFRRPERGADLTWVRLQSIPCHLGSWATGGRDTASAGGASEARPHVPGPLACGAPAVRAADPRVRARAFGGALLAGRHFGSLFTSAAAPRQHGCHGGLTAPGPPPYHLVVVVAVGNVGFLEKRAQRGLRANRAAGGAG